LSPLALTSGSRARLIVAFGMVQRNQRACVCAFSRSAARVAGSRQTAAGGAPSADRTTADDTGSAKADSAKADHAASLGTMRYRFEMPLKTLRHRSAEPSWRLVIVAWVYVIAAANCGGSTNATSDTGGQAGTTGSDASDASGGNGGSAGQAAAGDDSPVEAAAGTTNAGDADQSAVETSAPSDAVPVTDAATVTDATTGTPFDTGTSTSPDGAPRIDASTAKIPSAGCALAKAEVPNAAVYAMALANLRAPPSYDGVTPMPLIFVVHATGMMSDYTNLSRQAVISEKYLVAAPEAPGNANTFESVQKPYDVLATVLSEILATAVSGLGHGRHLLRPDHLAAHATAFHAPPGEQQQQVGCDGCRRHEGVCHPLRRQCLWRGQHARQRHGLPIDSPSESRLRGYRRLRGTVPFLPSGQRLPNG
jgi:hypothetical protein